MKHFHSITLSLALSALCTIAAAQTDTAHYKVYATATGTEVPLSHIIDAMAEGGKVDMPFEATFYSAKSVVRPKCSQSIRSSNCWFRSTSASSLAALPKTRRMGGSSS